MCFRERGRNFSLMELLVAISVIAILASLVGPSLTTSKEASMEVICGSNLRALGTEVTKLYFNRKLPFPADPFDEEQEGLVSREDPVQYLYAHMPPPKPPIAKGAQADGSGGSSGTGSGTTKVEPTPGSGSSGGSSTEPTETSFDLKGDDMLYLLTQGCPLVEENPLYGLASGNVPFYRSYSFLSNNAGRRYKAAYDWLISESYFGEISDSTQLANKRHKGSVNVYFKDGHIENLDVEDVEFP